MDLISREEAIDAVMNTMLTATLLMGESPRGSVEIYEAIRKLKALPSAQPRWIPCSERLPEKSGLYLVTTPFDRLTPVHSRYFNKRGEHSFWSGHPMNEVVAWMPLPQPWEGGQDG